MTSVARAEPRAPDERRTPRKDGVFRAFLTVIYTLSTGAVLALLWMGSAFYATPLAQRAHHEGYWTWKPGGNIGHPLGIVGGSMIVLLLVYSARKRLRIFSRLGPLSRWLDVHIYLGLFGPILVVLHSSFKVQGLVALSFWSMIAVALSGVLGRYLYLQIPRTRAGDEISLAEILEWDRALSDRLRREFGLPEAQLRRLDEIVSPKGGGGLGAAFVDFLIADLTINRRLRREAVLLASIPRSMRANLLETARQKAAVRRRIVFWDALHRLFHYWHVIHKPFAVVTYVFMAVHVVVASMTGYGWFR